MKRNIVLLCIVLLINTSGFSQKKSPITDGKTRLEMFEKHLKMKDTSAFSDLQWQLLGPTNISARCTDVEVVSPKGQSYTLYAAVASGGIWKSVNEGTTWEPVFEQAASTSIGDIALDPANSEVLWVGTGEANIFRSSMAGCGIYKTNDGGQSWEFKGLENTNTIARIIVDPENPNVVYVAASGHEWTPNRERGVYKTEDGGNTWQNILYINDMTGAIDLVMDPEDHLTLYAATWQRIRKKWNDPRTEENYTGSGIHRTTDGGKTWTKINSGLPEAQNSGRIGIDVARSNPDVLYAFVDNYEAAREAESEELDSYGRPRGKVIKGATVYRSENRGESWTLVSGLTEEMKTYMERHSATYGWVFGQIRVDPNDENTIYTMGLGLNVSEDGGKTFRDLPGMHGDHHGLWIDPENSNYLFNANDGGVSVSYDKGKSWRSFTDNLPAAQFFNIAHDYSDPIYVYGSIQDHGSYRGQVILERGRDKIPAVEFERAPGGEGSNHAIHPDNPDLVYSAGFYGTIQRSDMSKPWDSRTKRVLPGTYEDEPRLRGQWVAPFIISPHNPEIIYHGMQYVLKSIDGGLTWERISPDLTYNNPERRGDISFQTVSSISESPLKYGLIYAGTDDGRIHRTKDGGKTWTEIYPDGPKNKWVSRIVASKYKMETVYLTQNGKRDDDFAVYIWKSDDYGTTWKDISSNIPLGPVNVIREDPFDRNILYVGTDIGVYVTKDGGTTWNVLGDLPSCYVHDLVIHPIYNIIVIATHGRGVWVMDVEPLNNSKE
ncbi:MAG: hypothetical protein AMS27_17280 [Bacteroides sp. SM23_62_1]|nr:MAG: hypothetical protein AMS27_17280 [Bacteroides sp. SM23_62_1]